MSDRPPARAGMDPEAQAAFSMWVMGLVLLPISLLVFVVRQLVRKLRDLGKGG